MEFTMFVVSVPKEKSINDFSYTPSDKDNLLFRWDTHKDFQRLFHEIYRNKGGIEEGNQPIQVRLVEQDLDRLSQEVYSMDLYFDAKDSYEQEFWFRLDTEFLQKAYKALVGGNELYYHECW